MGCDTSYFRSETSSSSRIDCSAPIFRLAGSFFKIYWLGAGVGINFKRTAEIINLIRKKPQTRAESLCKDPRKTAAVIPACARSLSIPFDQRKTIP